MAVGHFLKRRGLPFVILDAHGRVGDAWRTRWDSLHLFSPARYDALPGMPFPGPPDRFPTKDEMADYLEAYAAHDDLPVAPASGSDDCSGWRPLRPRTSGTRSWRTTWWLRWVATSGPGCPVRRGPRSASSATPRTIAIRRSSETAASGRRRGQLRWRDQPGLAASHPTWLAGREVGQSAVSRRRRRRPAGLHAVALPSDRPSPADRRTRRWGEGCDLDSSPTASRSSASRARTWRRPASSA
jgi:putative flavoprotein involved in K+ transport